VKVTEEQKKHTGETTQITGSIDLEDLQAAIILSGLLAGRKSNQDITNEGTMDGFCKLSTIYARQLNSLQAQELTLDSIQVPF